MLISFILRHYLKFDKTQPFISITAILAFLGVGVGVAVLLITMSIMNGMIKEFERKLFIMNYPLTIFATSYRGLDDRLYEFLESKFPNLKISPYMQAQAVIRMNAEIYPVVVYGVDIAKEKAINAVINESKKIDSIESKSPPIPPAKGGATDRESAKGGVSLMESSTKGGVSLMESTAKGAEVTQSHAKGGAEMAESRAKAEATNIESTMGANNSTDSIITESKSPFTAIMGENLYQTLNLASDEKITLIFTELAPTGIAMTPRMKKFTPIETFSSGLKNYDNSIIYTTFEAIKAIKAQDSMRYEGFHIYSAAPFSDIHAIKAALSEYENLTGERLFADTQGWWEQNGNFFSAMQLEKKALFFVLMLIILMASLNIISSLLMVVMNRRKEIALLISLGASKKQVKSIFFRLGSVIGGGGVVFGVLSALVIIWVLKTFDIISIPADVYGTSRLPVELLFSDLIYTIFGALIIVALSSYYPAKKASQIDVLQVLRNE